MQFEELSRLLEEIDKLSGRTDIISLLSSLFLKLGKEEVGPASYLLLGKVAPDFEHGELGLGEKLILRAISRASGATYELTRQRYSTLGDLGLVAAELATRGTTISLLEYTREGRGEHGKDARSGLTVIEIYHALKKIAATSGEGSQETKLSMLTELLSNSSPLARKYIARIVSGDIRLGLAELTVLASLSKAFAPDDKEAVERAFNITCDIGLVASTLANQSAQGVRRIKVQPGRPLKPMLAERSSSIDEILRRMGGRAAFEYKYDGERVQIHKSREGTKIFSRRTEDITGHFPDVVKAANTKLSAQEFIVEGEVVAIDQESGRMLPFQELMHRRRKHGVEEAMSRYPTRVELFDLLFVDGRDFTKEPYPKRRNRLVQLLSPSEDMAAAEQIVTDDHDRAEAFFESALEDGCEGVMAKTLSNKVGYEAGSRGWAWIKYKRDYKSSLADTIDLVIVGGFHGRGKRAGKIGGYLLAAPNGQGRYETACKVATGFSDEALVEMEDKLRSYVTPSRHPSVDSRLEADVWYRPAIVMEILGAELTISPVHTAALDEIRKGSGLAVRFPRYTGRLRTDKSPDEATSTQELLEMYRSQLKKL